MRQIRRYKSVAQLGNRYVNATQFQTAWGKQERLEYVDIS